MMDEAVGEIIMMSMRVYISALIIIQKTNATRITCAD